MHVELLDIWEGLEEVLSKFCPRVGDHVATMCLIHEPIDLSIDPVIDSWSADPAESESNLSKGIVRMEDCWFTKK